MTSTLGDKITIQLNENIQQMLKNHFLGDFGLVIPHNKDETVDVTKLRLELGWFCP